MAWIVTFVHPSKNWGSFGCCVWHQKENKLARSKKPLKVFWLKIILRCWFCAFVYFPSDQSLSAFFLAAIPRLTLIWRGPDPNTRKRGRKTEFIRCWFFLGWLQCCWSVLRLGFGRPCDKTPFRAVCERGLLRGKINFAGYLERKISAANNLFYILVMPLKIFMVMTD